jgi:uncharacterized protein
MIQNPPRRRPYHVRMFFMAVLLAQLAGDAMLYRSGNHLFSLAKTDGDALLLLEYDSGRLSRLRLNEDQWIAGPSIGVENPVVVRVTIGTNTLTINRPGTITTAELIRPFTTLSVAGGTLYLPRTKGPHPTVVGVPGAGRSMVLPAPYFARRGIAVLALNQRSDWRSSTFENIADDVIAAVNTLRTRSEIDPKRIGLYASSQGGWVAPIAAVKSPSIAFIVCAACPATNLTTQEVIRTEAELRADGFKPAEVEEAVSYRKLFFDYLQTGSHQGELEAADQEARNARWYPRFGGVISRDAPLALWWQKNERFVPVDYWKQVTVPTLFLFGGLDTRVPPSEHARRISAAIPPAKVIIVPNVDHEGFIATTGGRDEVPLLDRIPPRAFEPTIDWILARR